MRENLQGGVPPYSRCPFCWSSQVRFGEHGGWRSDAHQEMLWVSEPRWLRERLPRAWRVDVRTKRVFFHGTNSTTGKPDVFCGVFVWWSPWHILRPLLSRSVVSTLVTTPDFQVSCMDPSLQVFCNSWTPYELSICHPFLSSLMYQTPTLGQSFSSPEMITCLSEQTWV